VNNISGLRVALALRFSCPKFVLSTELSLRTRISARPGTLPWSTLTTRIAASQQAVLRFRPRFLPPLGVVT